MFRLAKTAQTTLARRQSLGLRGDFWIALPSYQLRRAAAARYVQFGRLKAHPARVVLSSAYTQGTHLLQLARGIVNRNCPRLTLRTSFTPTDFINANRISAMLPITAAIILR